MNLRARVRINRVLELEGEKVRGTESDGSKRMRKKDGYCPLKSKEP